MDRSRRLLSPIGWSGMFGILSLIWRRSWYFFAWYVEGYWNYQCRESSMSVFTRQFHIILSRWCSDWRWVQQRSRRFFLECVGLSSNCTCGTCLYQWYFSARRNSCFCPVDSWGTIMCRNIWTVVIRVLQDIECCVLNDKGAVEACVT